MKTLIRGPSDVIILGGGRPGFWCPWIQGHMAVSVKGWIRFCSTTFVQHTVSVASFGSNHHITDCRMSWLDFITKEMKVYVFLEHCFVCIINFGYCLHFHKHILVLTHSLQKFCLCKIQRSTLGILPGAIVMQANNNRLMNKAIGLTLKFFSRILAKHSFIWHLGI